jgi:hypothetical protein
LAEHVDEAGRNDFAGGVYDAAGSSRVEFSDGGNAAVTNGDIGGIPGGAASIDYVTVFNKDVETPALQRT